MTFINTSVGIDNQLFKWLKKGRRRAHYDVQLRGWTWDANEFNVHNMMEKTNNNVFIGATDIYDYIVSQVNIERFRLQETTHHDFVTYDATGQQWREYINSLDFQVYWTGKDNGVVVDIETKSHFTFGITANSIEASYYGDRSVVTNWVKHGLDRFDEIKNVIEWMYSTEGRSVQVPLRNDREPFDEMYPWLEGETLKEYYDRYMESSANILLLLGPPGTGKTTFIRGLLQHTRSSAIATYDAAILSKDHIFAEFVEGNRNVMVIEDADTFLAAREDGNDMMHKFLNVGDGLVTTKNKKMIFSTNLTSISKIDSALVRPGRCFDVVSFNPLSAAQAERAAARLGIQLSKERKEWTIAEIFHQYAENKAPTRSIGFI